MAGAPHLDSFGTIGNQLLDAHTGPLSVSRQSGRGERIAINLGAVGNGFFTAEATAPNAPDPRGGGGGPCEAGWRGAAAAERRYGRRSTPPPSRWRAPPPPVRYATRVRSG